MRHVQINRLATALLAGVATLHGASQSAAQYNQGGQVPTGQTNSGQYGAGQYGGQTPLGQNPTQNQIQPAGQAQMGQTPGYQNQPQQVANPNQPVAPQANQAVAAPQPPIAPLSPELQQYLDKILIDWQSYSAKVQRFSCDFTRWEYDPSNGPADIHTSWATGVIRYMAPDKGMFRVDQIQDYAGMNDKNQPQYKSTEDRFGEYWVCDGKSVHVHERKDKIVQQIELPPEMQGTRIFNSPLPFLFGVNANEVKQRYWIQPLNPNGRANEVWLEAYPKYQGDAASYQKVQVVLDTTDFLPKALVVFLPNYRPDNQQRTVFEFTNREAKAGMLDQLKEKLFRDEFIPKDAPSGWKVIVTPYQADGTPEGNRVATPAMNGQGQPLR